MAARPKTPPTAPPAIAPVFEDDPPPPPIAPGVGVGEVTGSVDGGGEGVLITDGLVIGNGTGVAEEVSVYVV